MDNVTTGPAECQPSAPCIERNVLYVGHQLNRVQRREVWTNNHGWVGREEECQELCSRTLGCTWFNWGSDSLCWLKTGRGDLVMQRVEYGVSTGPGVCLDITDIETSHAYESLASAWNYQDPGPGAWSSQHPKCGGQNQSPINLVTKKDRTVSDLLGVELNFTNYDLVTANNTELLNNGHTLELELLSVTPSAALLSGGPFARSYQLLQLHFHWGENDTIGSEHAMDGEKFPMEMHLVHMTTDLDWGIESAIDPVDVKDGLAVTGFFFKISEEDNPAIAPIVDSLHVMREQKSSTHIEDENFAVSFLIQPVISGPYFSYSGSLTTPTCNEVVKWVVFKNTLEISSNQLAQFRTLSDSHGSALVNNFRPLQDIGNREVSFGIGEKFLEVMDVARSFGDVI